jgi:uncharacterized spore protein YtfJ
VNVQEILTNARDAMTVRRVFGEPYERDGVTVIPVAAVTAAAEAAPARTGMGPEGPEEGSGSGPVPSAPT